MPRNNPDAEARIEEVLATFRAQNMPIFHIRHASKNQESAFRADRPGFAVNPKAMELPGESVLIKSVNSAFIGTDLEARLRAAAIDTLVICGATTNYRMVNSPS